MNLTALKNENVRRSENLNKQSLLRQAAEYGACFYFYKWNEK